MEVTLVRDIHNINTGYSANNPEPIEMREESVKTKQEDALHSALEYINGDNGEVQKSAVVQESNSES